MYQSRSPSHINFKSMFENTAHLMQKFPVFFCRIYPLWNIILKAAIHIAVKRNIICKSRQNKIHVLVVVIISRH